MSQANPTDIEATVYAAEWVVHGDQTRAWRKTFPDSKAAPETQHARASLFHKIHKVQIRIGELQGIAKQQSEEEFSLSVGEIKKYLTKAMKKGLKNKKDAQGNKVPVSVSGAVSAIAEINKMDGNHAATKLALGGDPDAPPVETQVTVTHEIVDGASESQD